MALYTGSGSNAAQQPQMYGVPGGMYIKQQQQQQPQMQKNPANMYNSPLQTPYHPQPHVMPMHMQQHLMQHPTPQQQQAQVGYVCNNKGGWSYKIGWHRNGINQESWTIFS